MRIIFGLGNPGTEYIGTRHNIGFEIGDKIKADLNSSEWEFNKKFNADISKVNDVMIAKPQTFMNLSGDTVKAILDFYKLTPDDIIVIHDDLDIAAGKYKIATESSSAGHNGVQDIIDKLITKKFKRIRVGIGEESADGTISCRLGAHDFVLGKFTSEELEKINMITAEIITELKKIVASK